jgi:hypothetical protein
MTSTTTKTCLSLSSKTLAPASFDATLTSATLLHGVATFPELHCVTKAHGSARTALTKTRPQPGDGVSAFLCNFLDDHGVKPVKVLKKAGLRHETQADWHSGDAVHALYMASQCFMPQTLHTDKLVAMRCELFAMQCAARGAGGAMLLTEGFLGWGVWADGWAEEWVDRWDGWMV